MNEKTSPAPIAVEILYVADTADGEHISGSIFTISTNKMADATKQILDKYPNEVLHNLCLSQK